ncbi:PREDICTED: uncharacterized protein LOC109340122 isoform X2 [Lupinus angustifolius]|uniref:uncharacterized protein LOC109340122 isoform X2 n=1 Tax=Lupinus angustifolius TaxID=3871 RepID=UPI00092EA6EE|nr:PREDICTED: uncharacterized protein LOC109340122 isoform X2 [Lupinus angustifolius]
MAKASHYAHFDKDNNHNGFNTTELETEFGFPSEFPYEFDSFGLENLNSPLESVEGSTETESSDEEDFFAGLTRRLSQASLHETRLSQASLHETRLSQLTVPISNINKTEKVRVISGSPQSTLNGIGYWSGQSPGSGEESPNESSRVPSPNTTPFANDALDSVYTAAEHVARLKINDDVPNHDFQKRGFHSIFPQHVAADNHATQLFNHNNLNHASRMSYFQLKEQCGSVWGRESNPTFSTYQQQLQVQNKVRDFGYGCVKCTHPLPQPAWNFQQQNQLVQGHVGSGSRPVLNGGSSVKRGCAGTGVFLPRQYVVPSEPRSKTTCAPVIVPAKVIHVLNSNIEVPNATAQRFVNAYGADYNVLLARRNAILMQQKLSLGREEATSFKIRLPHEWTY